VAAQLKSKRGIRKVRFRVFFQKLIEIAALAFDGLRGTSGPEQKVSSHQRFGWCWNDRRFFENDMGIGATYS
jgi:hypothetical protein